MKVPILKFGPTGTALQLYQLFRNHFFQALLFLINFIILLVVFRRASLGIDLFQHLIYSFSISVFFWATLSFSLGQLSLKKCVEILQTSLLIFLFLASLILQTDRSRSNYVLSWIDTKQVTIVNGNYLITINNPEASNIKAIQQRLMEHQRRNLLVISGQQVKLTNLGTLALNCSKLLAGLFRLEGWQEGTKNYLVPPP